MGRNEKTSQKLATLAAKILSGSKKATQKDAKSLAGGVLTQTPDRIRQSKYRGTN